jgi:ubiquilin
MFGGAGAGMDWGNMFGAFGGAQPFGGTGTGTQPFGGSGTQPFGGSGTQTGAAPSTQPPEERFREQLQQLQDMGFTDRQANIAALVATNGFLQGAIERLLN